MSRSRIPSEPCSLSGPCPELDSYMRRTNPFYHEGYIVWGSLKMRQCIFCREDLPDVVLRKWDWKEYEMPSVPAPNPYASEDCE